MNKERRLPILYHIQHVEEGVPVSELPEGHGIADSIFIGSVINDEEDESKRNFSFMGIDGQAGDQMSPEEVFEIWTMMAFMMKENNFFEEEDPRHSIIHKTLEENEKFTSSYVETEEEKEVMEKEPSRIIH